MRTKKVNRYWCDFCNKAGLQSKAMQTHEKHCTLNPARDCRVCGLIGASTNVGAERMAELVAILPDATAFNDPACGFNFDGGVSEHTKLLSKIVDAMPMLREETDNCPACIMAAIRQAKIPVPMVDSFNFTAEIKSVFSDVNERRCDDRDW